MLVLTATMMRVAHTVLPRSFFCVFENSKFLQNISGNSLRKSVKNRQHYKYFVKSKFSEVKK